MYSKLLFTLLFAAFTSLLSAQPQFKGGKRSLGSFISNNLIYPEYSKTNCLQGTVTISFKVTSQGAIYHSEVQKGFGIDLDQEALRLVRLSSGRWVVPADHDTLTSLVLPVNFSLKDFRCEERSRDQINLAINAYQARMGLTQGIFNFYDKKAEGDFKVTDEIRIRQLKQELGYDEEFMERLLKQGRAKLKQGDKQGACEDFQTIRRLGSSLSEDMIHQNCQ